MTDNYLNNSPFVFIYFHLIKFIIFIFSDKIFYHGSLTPGLLYGPKQVNYISISLDWLLQVFTLLDSLGKGNMNIKEAYV